MKPNDYDQYIISGKYSAASEAEQILADALSDGELISTDNRKELAQQAVQSAFDMQPKPKEIGEYVHPMSVEMRLVTDSILRLRDKELERLNGSG